MGGGAIFALFQSELRLNNCRFEDNFAKHIGGAFFLNENVTSEIQETIFSGNKASYGGAIYNELNITLCIQEITFTSNLGLECGGAHIRKNCCEHKNKLDVLLWK